MRPHSINVAPSRRYVPHWSAQPTPRTGLRGYERLSLAGSGSFAEVWLARDNVTGTLCALKALRPDCENPAAARQLLVNEFEAARSVESPHVVRALDASLEEHAPHVVFEWLSGQTLEAFLARHAPLPCVQALWLARQCAQGLRDLVAAGLTHGDVKPSNIFLCQSGLAKLIDLGFARRDERVPHGLDAEDAVLRGTPAYLAPETLSRGDASGIGRDLYSLGVTLYRMLSGRLPYEAASVPEVLRQHQQGLAPRLRSLVPHVPGEVEELVHRLMSKQPLRRSLSLRELVYELLGLELLSMGSDDPLAL